MYTIIPISALKDNYIWAILDENQQTAWIVDPGDAAPVIHYLCEHRFTLAGILLTHHHADHSRGIPDLLAEWSVPVYGSTQSRVPDVSHRVKEGDEIHCGQLTLNVMEIPGHTLDHIAFYNQDVLFCGDTLFSAGCGRVFEGTYAEMHHSLTKLSNLPDSLKIYCGHEYTLQNLRFGELVEPKNHFIQEKMVLVNQLLANGKPTLPSLLRDEKKLNPFLRCQKKTVIQAASHYANKNLANSEEIFKTLREWKNVL